MNFQSPDKKNLEIEPNSDITMANQNVKPVGKKEILSHFVKLHLQTLFKIIQLRSKSDVCRSFYKIKRIYQVAHINKIKSKIIFESFKKHLKNCLSIRRRITRKSLQKNFFKYRTIVFMRQRLLKLKNEIEHGYEKRKEKEIVNLETRIKEKENEISENKKQIEINAQHIAELNKKAKQQDEGFANFTQNLKKLEKEKKQLEDEIRNLEKNKKENETYYSSLENKLKEYESEIKSLTELHNEKDVCLNLFIKEMNDILEAHEKLPDLIPPLLENEESKQQNTNLQTNQNKQSIPSQKPSIKSGMISSSNLSFKVLPNPSAGNSSISSQQQSNKTQITTQAGKGIFINQNTSASNLGKLNYVFNKTNISTNTSSVNVFKSNNIK